MSVARALILGGIVLASACTRPTTLGGQCELNSECEAPLVCRLDRCRRACVRTIDCPTRLACVLDDQGRGSCLLEDEVRCVQASDCLGGLVCRFGRCTNECETDADCVPPARCFEDPEEAGTRACFVGDVEPTACVRDLDCEGLQRCFADGLCRPRCLADRDCGPGEACRNDDGDLRNNECVFVGMDAGAPDAGVDAGGVDAGGVDAGGDSGFDAGPILIPCSTPEDCAVAGTVTTCSPAGFCEIIECEPNREDCDGDPSNGCETNLVSATDCGACGVPCADRCTGTVCTTDRVVEVSAGRTHTCARMSGGEVFCWGGDGEGQLGDGTADSYMLGGAPPAQVPGLTGATSVCAGGEHSCAIHSGGVSCWGAGDSGQIGPAVPISFSARSATPVLVPGVTNAVQIVCGQRHTCVRRSDGTALCWGENGVGELGDGGNTDRNTPMPVVESMTTPTTPLSGIASLAAGSAHTCATLTSGDVVCWGRSDDGQLGDGTSPSFGFFGEEFPQPMLSITNAVETAGGGGHGCVRHGASGGAVSCSGSNFRSQLGDGTTTDRGTMAPVTGVATASGVAAGSFHACAMYSSGQVRCWGLNQEGQAGNGRMETTFTVPSDPVTGLSDATQIDAGDYHTCAVRASGDVVCWGTNGWGELGDGTSGCCGYVEGNTCFDYCDLGRTPRAVVGL